MINRTKQILTSVFIVLTLLTLKACIEEENDFVSQNCGTSCAVIKGIITTNDGIQPMTGVEVTATWINTYYLGGGTIRKKAKTRTDNFGAYTLKFGIRDDELKEGYFLFEILIDKKEYFRCGDEYPSFASFELHNDTIITQDLFIPYLAHLNIGAVGAENMSNSDYFSVTITPDISITSNACGAVIGWSNQYPNWTYNIDVPANLNLSIETVIRKGELYERAYDTLLINKEQTQNYTAVYK